MRVFKKEPDSGLFEAFISYFEWKDEFSAEAWHLDEYLKMYNNEGNQVNLVALWSTLPFPGTKNTGRGQLACLAKLVLSVDANSAGGERLFSRMGHIHTKRRNRLHHEKVHDIATVALDLEAQHKAAGLTRKRQRRHFDEALPQPAPAIRQTAEAADTDSNPYAEGSDDDSEVDLTDEDERVAVDFEVLAAKLIEGLDEDEDEAENAADEQELPELPVSPTRQRRVRLFFGTAHPVPLRELFNFSSSVEGVEGGLGVFWNGGIQNLVKEREVYEAIA